MSEHAESEPAPPITIDANAVLAERVSHLYSQLPIGIALTFVIGALASYELWELQLSRWVGVWWAFVVVVTVASALLYVAYRRSESSARHGKRWLSWLSVCVIATGVGWGPGRARLLPPEQQRRACFPDAIAGRRHLGRYRAVRGIVAALCRVRGEHRRAVHLRARHLRQSAVCRDRARPAVLLRSPGRDRAPPAHGCSRRDTGCASPIAGSRRRTMRKACASRTRCRSSRRASRDPGVGTQAALYSERAPIAVFEMDSNGTILDMNPAAETMFGHAVSELVGRNLVRTLIPQDEAALTQSWWASLPPA
jgi:PAS domain-containing protein